MSGKTIWISKWFHAPCDAWIHTTSLVYTESVRRIYVDIRKALL